MTDSTAITRVVLENYKSIVSCDVPLGPLTFLVGTNGAGKSNFVDALSFVADALRNSLEYAVRERGGITAVLTRSSASSNEAERPLHLGMRLDFKLPFGATGHYAFRIRADAEPWGLYRVEREECFVQQQRDGYRPLYFKVQTDSGQVNTNAMPNLAFVPVASRDRLYLVNAAGLPDFRPVYDELSAMRFYNISARSIRHAQTSDGGERLAADGANLAPVLARLARQDAGTKERIDEYLAKVISGPQAMARMKLEPQTAAALESTGNAPFYLFDQAFPALAMSDGTLHALGVLVAAFQSTNGHTANGMGQRVPLVGIEEPEATLHPAAAAVLFDSLQEASRTTQIVVTSHSPDLLDSEDLDVDAILAVVADDGVTKIARLDEPGRSALHDRLYTAGELLRIDQLKPDPRTLQQVCNGRPGLFDG